MKITDKELEEVKDDNDDVHFSKVMEFCFPRFDIDNDCVAELWEW